MKEIKKGSARAWLLAARPKTLSAAAVPVLAGWSLAYADGGFDIVPALLCLLFALLMQVAANFMNDYADFVSGGDTPDRLGPPRACAEGWISEKAMLRGIFLTVAAACAAGFWLLFYGGWQMIFVGLGCVVFATLYSPLARVGMGDLLVLLFFGLAAVGFTYYVMCNRLTAEVLAAAAGCGIAIDTLLTVNNIRDREQDASTGKRTLVVRLGPKGGRLLYLSLGIVATAAAVAVGAMLRKPAPLCLLPLIYAAAHAFAFVRLGQIGAGRGLNKVLGLTSLNIIVYGAVLVTVIIA